MGVEQDLQGSRPSTYWGAAGSAEMSTLAESRIAVAAAYPVPAR